MSYHILVVEDNVVVRNKLVKYLEREGYQVSDRAGNEPVKEYVEQNSIDLVIMALDGPMEYGWITTRQLRHDSDIGIVLTIDSYDNADKIIGLEMGADDVLVKPYELRELLARIKNVFWRMSKSQPESVKEVEDRGVCFGDWTFDVQRRTLSCRGEPMKLTKAEYELLVAFSSYPNKVMSREEILNMISHRVDAPNDRTIDVLVRRMRAKLEFDPKNPQIFITVHGEGYMFAR